jgi:chromosome partitioning protein
MKTITIGIQKGGTGKTTTAVSLAGSLSKIGKTLIIDCDTQGNATEWLLGQTHLESELAQVLNGEAKLEKAILGTKEPGLFVLPSASVGSGLDVYSRSHQQMEVVGRFKKLKTEIEKRGYQFIICDLGPHFGFIEQGAYLAADEIVTVINPEQLAVSGLEIFQINLKTINDMFDSTNLTTGSFNKIVINMVNRSIKQHRVIADEYPTRFKDLNFYIVPQEPAFRQAIRESKIIQASGLNAKAETLAAFSNLAQSVKEN